MATKEFDNKFLELQTAMVEIAFEFVNRNEKEVDNIYVYASMEEGDLFYNVYYKINGKNVKLNKLNDVLNQKVDISDDRVFNLFDLGMDYLEETLELFENDEREVPTLMKMTYSPKTGAFNNDISYELHYSNSDEKTNADVFEEWFDELNK